MKKVVLASFLAVAAFALGMPLAFAQDAPPAAGGAVQMPADEYAVYNNAWTMPQANAQNMAAKATALEAYLVKYPQSAAKEPVLEAIMVLDYSVDHAKALDAADRLLQVNPKNIKALYVETLVRDEQAAALTDPTAQQAALDSAASYAQKALAAPKPAGLSDADFTALKAAQYPTFYSAIGSAARNKKDATAAIDAYKKELASVPVDQTKVPGPLLQDTFYLGQEYMQATPPDYLSCAFYTSRAVAYAPDQYKSVMSPTAKYCYKKYHGADDGYDALLAAATANLNPPADLSSTVKAAPTPAETIAVILKGTDPATLATSDKEYILQNGTPDQQATVWGTMKGKSYQFPDVLVIASTPTQIQVAISDDAVQSKTADFTFNLKAPDDLPAGATAAQKAAYKKKQDAISAATAVGQKVTLSGTFDSYTPSPITIVMSDGEVVLKAAPAKAPAHTAHRAH